MPDFGVRSKQRLTTCHPELQRLFNEVIKEADCTVLCGYRGKAEQEAAFASGNSKARWGQSKHNRQPSLAADVVPYPVSWDDIPRFVAFVNLVKKKAKELNINIRCGADFTKLKDYPHFELVGVE